MWNVRALLRPHAGNFWAHSCYGADRFCKLCRTWLKRYWLVKKHQCMRDRKRIGGRQESLSLFPFFPWETSASREEWLSGKMVFEDGVPSPQHVTKSLESLRGRLISKRFIRGKFFSILLSLIQKLLTLSTKNWKICFFNQWHRRLRRKKICVLPTGVKPMIFLYGYNNRIWPRDVRKNRHRVYSDKLNRLKTVEKLHRLQSQSGHIFWNFPKGQASSRPHGIGWENKDNNGT